ncbi:MAG: PAS domain S-box protein [Nitrospiraceae bacterium]|nr:MAG: PAS domain S-box protein [Nitrospiraceae bacterium]
MNSSNVTLDQLIRKVEDLGLLDAISDGISIQDRNFQIWYQNRAHRDFMGSHAGEYCYHAYESQERVCDGCPVALSFRDGNVHRTERSVPTESGTMHFEITSSPLRAASGEIIAAVEVVRDITRRTASEESLRESEERYRRLVGSIEKKHFLYSHGTDGVFTYISPSIADILGYSQEEFCTHYTTYLTENPVNRRVTRHTNLSIMGEQQPSYEVEIFHKDGSIHWLEVSEVPVFDRAGRVTAVEGIAHDITERRKLEEQLLQSQKLEAVGRLAGGIAHDFNNMLTAIISYGHLLKMKMKTDDLVSHNIDQIISVSERGAALIRNLLVFSRKQAADLKPMNVNSLVEGVEKMITRLIGEEIEFKVELSPDEIVVNADRGQVEQAIINLVLNARDAMPKGGMLTIGTAKEMIDAEHAASRGCSRPGAYARIDVADTGTGMDRATREKIFEPFFTTKVVGAGSGLGLSIVYGIVSQHGGSVTVSSKQGAGSVFSIYLPLIKAKASETAASRPMTELRGEGTILIAEDEKEVRESLCTILEEFGFSVIAACDGEEALQKFAEYRGQIRLLILDVIMPKKNGSEVYDEIRNTAPGIKALFMSGYTAQIIQEKGILEKDTNFIYKPLSVDDLAAKIKTLLAADS